MKTHHSPLRTASLRALVCTGMGLAAASPAVAQQCIQDYLEAQPDLLDGCTIAASPCTVGQRTTFRVSGNGFDLQALVEELTFFPPFTQTGPWVIEVGPDLEPAPGVVETYDPIVVVADMFPFGLSIVSRWGPDTVTIDAAGSGSAVFVENTSGAGGPFRLGLATTGLIPGATFDERQPPVDYEGWHGFTITGGLADAGGTIPNVNGGGIHISSFTSRLDIAGNVILGNSAQESGGGLYLDGCTQCVVAANEIANNSAGATGIYGGIALHGGGVDQRSGHVEYIANDIHGNGFGGDMMFLAPEMGRRGGGISATLTTGFAPVAQMCGNYIHGNEASEGGGVWIDMFSFGNRSQAHLQQNIVASNSSWVPNDDPTGLDIDGSYRGGGVWISGDSTASGIVHGKGAAVSGGTFALAGTTEGFLPGTVVVPFVDMSLSATMVNNRLISNVVANPGFAPTAVDGVGGGLYCEVTRNDDTDQVGLVGNAAVRNDVLNQGAGFYLDNGSTQAAITSGELHHNTLAWNVVTDAAGAGSGLFLTAPTRFDGSSNVIFNNRVGSSASVTDNWFGEPGVADDLRFTQMTLALPIGSENLVGAACDAADPLLVSGGWGQTDPLGPVVDSAEDGLPMLLSVDLEFHPRVVDRFINGTSTGADRGADEYLGFLRGDANADGCLDIADSIYMLNALFVPGSPALVCPLAGDVNGDGSFNIADVVFNNNVLFGSLPVPGWWGVCEAAPVTPGTFPVGAGTPCDC